MDPTATTSARVIAPLLTEHHHAEWMEREIKFVLVARVSGNLKKLIGFEISIGSIYPRDKRLFS